MKINLLLPLALMLALVPLSGIQARHQFQGADAVPLPVKECFNGIELYRQMFISRAAGMTLEETQLDNEFTIRVLKYVADNSPLEYEERIAIDLDAKTVEVYKLPDPQYLDPDWQATWATVRFDECIAAIPSELIGPPKPLDYEKLEPLEPLEDQFQLQRMIPEISI